MAALAVFQKDGSWHVTGKISIKKVEEKIDLQFKTKAEAEKRARELISAFVYVRGV
jgi:CBS domain containing-hemolysin-like protein